MRPQVEPKTNELNKSRFIETCSSWDKWIPEVKSLMCRRSILKSSGLRRLQSGQNLTGQISQLGQLVCFGEEEAAPYLLATASLSATAAVWQCVLQCGFGSLLSLMGTGMKVWRLCLAASVQLSNTKPEEPNMHSLHVCWMENKVNIYIDDIFLLFYSSLPFFYLV